MPYFSPEACAIYKDSQKWNDLEVDKEKGFVLWYSYTTYDSFGSSDYTSYGLVGVYDTYKTAAEFAKKLREKADDYRCSDYKVDGKTIWELGWGSSIRDIFVDYCELKKQPKKRVF